MKLKSLKIMLIILLVFGVAISAVGAEKKAFTEDFMIERCTFSNVGSNPYFVLEPGFQLVLEGEDNKQIVRLVITVLNETETITFNGIDIETRVVEENESKDGQVVEISRNFFAICNDTNSIFYFGEEVDIFNEDGTITHEGAWRAGEGVNGGEPARPGIIMPGTLLLGARYFQEIAPDVAMDRAEILSISEVVETPADTFERCLKTIETSPLEPNAKDFKFYAPGIGLIVDGPISLTEVSFP